VSPGTGLPSPGRARFRQESFVERDPGIDGRRASREICWRLALVGRAMAELWDRRGLPDVPFLVPLAVDLRPKGAPGPTFGNSLAFHFARFTPAETTDVADLAQALRRQMTDALRDGQIDANAVAMEFLKYRPVSMMLRYLPGASSGAAFSFHCADVMAFPAGLESMFGRRVVNAVWGLYQTSPSGPPETLNEGFAESFARRLATMPGCGTPVRRGRTFVLPYTPFAFASLADQLTLSATHLDVYLHAYLVGVETRAGRIEALRIATWERVVDLEVRAVVDASGDAVVAHQAGAATETTPVAERQLPSLVFVLQHVDTDALGPGPRVALLRALAAAEREGRLPKGASNLALAPSPQTGEVICKLTLSGIAEELPVGRDLLTMAEQEGRKRALAVTELLKTMPAFTRAFVSHAAPQVGVRESRRVIGRYQLTREDVLSGHKFEDAAA